MFRSTEKPRKVRSTKKESLSEKAYNYIAHRLMSGALAPGDLINRRQVASELRISVAPVLEAMVQLESDGFLQSVPRKGTLVRSIKPEDLRGELILREAYECQAARIYCGEPVRSNMAHLLVLANEVEDNYQNPDKAWNSEFEFHLALIELTECGALIQAFRKVMQRKFFMSMHLYLQIYPESFHDNHVRLLKALAASDPDIAEKAMHRHFAGRSKLVRVPSTTLHRQ